MRGFVSCVLLALAACSGSPTAVERPNLILVVGDDHGYPDFGFMGSPYVRTPNLDRLAAEGTVFRNGYVTASSCGPSLRSLLTGLHPIQTYYEGLRQLKQRAEGGAPPGPSITLPRVLAEAGYVSFQGGKFSERDYQVAGFSDGMQRPGDDPAFGGVGRLLGRDSLEPLFDFIDAHESVPFSSCG